MPRYLLTVLAIHASFLAVFLAPSVAYAVLTHRTVSVVEMGTA